MFNVGQIHDLIKTELRGTYPDIQIDREGSSNLNSPNPRLSYLLITDPQSPRHRMRRDYTDPGGIPTTVYTDYIYSKFRYNLIVDKDSGAGIKSSLQVLQELSDLFIRYIRSQEFETLLTDLGVQYTINGGFNEVIIPRDPFFERRNFIEITYGYIESYSRAEGSFIENVNYQNTN